MVTEAPRIKTNTTFRFTGVIAEPMYWSVIEVNVGIMAASIPSYKALVKKYFPLLLGITFSGGVREGASPGYRGKGYIYSNGSYSLDRAKNGVTDTTVTGGHHHLGSGSSSEEQIICPDGMMVRTTAVVVDESHSVRCLTGRDHESRD